jgi:GNAT superfamily N-acetyltransferase
MSVWSEIEAVSGVRQHLPVVNSVSPHFALGAENIMLCWSVVDSASEADLAVLSEGVVSYGRSLAAGGNAKPIACLVRNEQAIVAGASGRTEFNRLFVGYLWVAENLRAKGIGSKVLLELEHAAIGRGCADSLLETLSASAAELYARLGYRHLAQVPGFVGPFTKHVMLKSFAGSEGARGA